MQQIFRKYFLLVVLVSFSIATSCSQILKPVKWKFSSETNDKGETFLILKATIDEGWHLYSQKNYGDEGPILSSFTFEKSSNYETLGAVKEGKNLVKEMDKQWGFEIEFYEKTATFKQTIKSKTDKPYTVKGSLEFMVCNESQCLPPETVEYEIKVEPAVSAAVEPKPDTATPKFLTPVKWDWTVSKPENNICEISFKAAIEDGWHLYGLNSGSSDILPIEIVLSPSADYELVDSLIEGTPVVRQEPVMDNAMLAFFEKEATFKQKIKIKTEKAFSIKGRIEFQSCNDKQCVNGPGVDVEIKMNEGAPIQVTDEAEVTDDSSFWRIFIFGFLGGLAALLTPCVFPMIPFTVSFFTKRSKTRAAGIRNAITYGIAIIIIYVALGLGVTLAFGPDALNALSTNVWFNLGFFALLVVFATSFLGAFEIVLPSSFINKVDAKSERGGLMGIFFMAFTLSLVSFSCTGPIIGTLLVDAAVNGGIKGPFWGMLGFSTALALPFGLFAAFPGWLNSLPKSGGWLNSVKVVLGFLELALALKFASNADLVVQAGIITREVFLVLWIVIFGLMGIYLMGWIKFAHDSDMKHLSVTRLFFAIITFSFTVYMIPGLWGAPLKLIAGFPPPDFYAESPNGVGYKGGMITVGESKPGDHKKEHCPNDLPCFHDYDEALAYAKKVNKPLMIDFTGWACVNCRRMESQVWIDPTVDQRLRNEVVLVSLYVDDKTELPESEKRVEQLGGEDWKIKTIGKKWSYLQASKYGSNSQPQYFILDHNENKLTPPAGYDADVAKYVKWLDDGIAAFKKGKK